MNTTIKGGWKLLCGGASFQAVQQSRQKGRFTLARGFRFVASLGGTAYLGYVAESPGAILIAFRGTENLFDLLTDFNWRPVEYPFAQRAGSVHRGFAELYERRIRPQLYDILRRIAARKRLLLTGYSLGGAIATLAALDIAVNTRYAKPWVYTFGSPKVGDAGFAAAYDRTISVSVRVVNVHDFVPVFPPINGNSPYVHVKKSRYVHFRHTNPLSNHQLRHYIAALGARYSPAYNRFRKISPGFLP